MLLASKTLLLGSCGDLPIYDKSCRRIVVIRRDAKNLHVSSQTTREWLLDFCEASDGVFFVVAACPICLCVPYMLDGQRIKTK